MGCGVFSVTVSIMDDDDEPPWMGSRRIAEKIPQAISHNALTSNIAALAHPAPAAYRPSMAIKKGRSPKAPPLSSRSQRC